MVSRRLSLLEYQKNRSRRSSCALLGDPPILRPRPNAMSSLRKHCTRLVVILAACGLSVSIFFVLARQVLLITHASPLVLWGGLGIALVLALGAGVGTWRAYRAWEDQHLPDRWSERREEER